MKSNNPYTEPGWEKALERLGADPLTADEFGNLTIPICDLAAAIRDLHAKLATAKADLDRKDRTIIALEELRRQTEYVHSERIKEKEILAYDTGKKLEAVLVELATAKADGAAAALEKICMDKSAAIRKGIDAPPAEGITDTERLDEIENRKIHVQYRDGAPLSVEKWVARNDDGMWTASTARAAIDAALRERGQG